MTNLHNAPYFLMSGPAKYILSLEKADPSAKTYAFEYKWDKNETNNNILFSFDTPNSKVCIIKSVGNSGWKKVRGFRD